MHRVRGVHVSRRSIRTLALLAVAGVFALVGFAPGCKKQPESLLIVDMEASDANGAGVRAVEIRVSGPAPSTEIAVAKIFDLPATGLPMGTAFEVGIYVPAGVTGMLTVTAIARPGTGCNGYVGTKPVKVDGGDTTPVVMTMRATNVCTLAGTAGTGGSTGMGGMGGSTVTGCGTVGTPPAVVAPPSLASCAEFDQNPAGVVCDPSIDDFNPWINKVAVSPDGQLLATAGADSFANGSVKIWRMQGNTPVPCGPVIVGSYKGAPYIAFSPDGQFLAIAWEIAYVETYRVPTFNLVGESRSSGSNFLYGVGWSADSQTVFSMDWDGGSDGTLHADRTDGTAITSLRIGVDPDMLAVSPVAVGGVTPIAVSGYDGNAAVFNWNGASFQGPMVLPTAPGAHGWGIGFSANGKLLAVGTTEGIARFWNIPITSMTPTGTSISVGSANTINEIAFSPGSDFVALAFGMQAEIWNVATRTFVSRRAIMAPVGATSNITFSATFSASGGALVVGEQTCGKVLVCSD
jgi:WD40 repeat protein